MYKIVLFSAVLATSVISADINNFEKLTVQISDDVSYKNCNQTLRQLEVRIILFNLITVNKNIHT